MTEIAATEDRIAPFREHILANLAAARHAEAFAAAEARGQEAQALTSRRRSKAAGARSTRSRPAA
jgi:hypothetical protein